MDYKKAINDLAIVRFCEVNGEGLMPFGDNIGDMMVPVSTVEDYIAAIKGVTKSDNVEWSKTFEEAIKGRVYYAMQVSAPECKVFKIILGDDHKTVYICADDTIVSAVPEKDDCIFATPEDAKKAYAMYLLHGQIKYQRILENSLSKYYENIKEVKAELNKNEDAMNEIYAEYPDLQQVEDCCPGLDELENEPFDPTPEDFCSEDDDDDEL